MKRHKRGITGVLIGGICALMAACAQIGVQPWERDVLARHAMQLNPSPTPAAADDHIYFSKEGASGGRSFDGGGCGCN